jgi:3-hydroxyisobutyrate dehydrogenase-like beta-hydroxyacid dehydrogenase
MKPAISVIGAGHMGSALVRAFLEQGFDTTVWNRTRSKCEPLAAAGARVAASVEEAVAASDIVVVNVSDYTVSDRLLRPAEVTHGLSGKLLVQLTSGTPRQARATAEWARQHGVHYLDGAIMATPNLVGGPAGTVVYSGSSDLFEGHRSVLLALGEHAILAGGDPGHAAALDTSLLFFMWGALFSVVQGAAVCEAEGVALDEYLGYLAAIRPALDGWVADLGERVRDGRFEAEHATIDAHHGGIRLLLEMCEEHGIRREIPEAFDAILRSAVDAGHGRDDFAALSKFMR